MQIVSDAYRKSMEAPLRNRGYIKATIGVINQDAQDDVFVDGEKNSLMYFSHLTNPFNGFAVTSPYATCEHGYSIVDGGLSFAPKEGEAGGYHNQGLVVKPLMGSLLVSFPEGRKYDIKGMTVDFGHCYPTRLKVETGARVFEFDNGGPVFRTEQSFDGTEFFKLTPLEMSNGTGRLRIRQFICGISNVFTNHEVKNYSCKEHSSSVTESIPSVDMSLTVDNQSLYYSPDNPESTYAYFEQGQDISVSFGYDLTGRGDIEWLPPNVAKLKSWKATDTEAKFTAVDLFEYQFGGTYHKGKYRPEGISLHDLLLDVLEDAGITDEREYEIDPFLKDIIAYNPLPQKKHGECLQIIANAARCMLALDRTNKLYIKSAFIPEVVEIRSNSQAEWSRLENVLENFAKNAYAMTGPEHSFLYDDLTFWPTDKSYAEDGGYVSGSVYGTDESWSGETPEISIRFEGPFSLYGVALMFRGSWPQEMEIHSYNGDVERDSYTLNPTSVICQCAHAFLQFDRLSFKFTKGRPGNRIHVDLIEFGDVTDYTLTRDKHLIGSPVAERMRQIRSISVMKTRYSEGAAETKDLLTEKLNLSGSRQEHTVYFSNAAYNISPYIKEGSAGKVRLLDSGAYMAKLEFTDIPPDGMVEYGIRGKEYSVSKQPYKVPHSPNGDDLVWENPLISDDGMAEGVERWLAQHFLGDVDYQIKWRGDPRIDVGDLLMLEIKDRGTVLIRSYQNELKFNGAWSGTIKARKTAL